MGFLSHKQNYRLWFDQMGEGLTAQMFYCFNEPESEETD